MFGDVKPGKCLFGNVRLNNLYSIKSGLFFSRANRSFLRGGGTEFALTFLFMVPSCPNFAGGGSWVCKLSFKNKFGKKKHFFVKVRAILVTGNFFEIGNRQCKRRVQLGIIKVTRAVHV